MKIRSCLRWLREADSAFDANTQREFRISLLDEAGNNSVEPDENVITVRFEDDELYEEFEIHADTEVEIKDNEILVNVDGACVRLTLLKTVIVDLK